ncbi:hypothetical protein EY693_08045 [Enterococcus casseliflavus]|nr:hypothetical protein [Enterococcus casseliflavus]MBO6376284.1 hypothetical protein [Enterococcus casseliflavus]MBO6386598.1 hypothetical protein [Enterococcus casseliflavus]
MARKWGNAPLILPLPRLHNYSGAHKKTIQIAADLYRFSIRSIINFSPNGIANDGFLLFPK